MTQLCFSSVMHKKCKRTEAFVRLSQRFEVDFGFVVYKSSSNIAEFLLLPELASMEAEGRTEESDMVAAIKAYYQAFDNEIKTLRESFPDSELIFVSDHGMAPREYSFNPNRLLQVLSAEASPDKNAKFLI